MMRSQYRFRKITMKKHIGIFILWILTMTFSSAHLMAASSRPASLPGGTFDDHLSAWPLTDEYAVGPWGRDGGMALKCERTKPQYHFMSRPITLKHGRAYRLNWWMKIDGTLPGEGAAVSVDWYSHGAWTSFTMLKLIQTTGNEWIRCSGEFTAPSNPDFTFMLLAYLRNGTQGVVYFDDFSLEEIIGESNVYPLNDSNGIIYGHEPLDVRVFVSGDMTVPKLEFNWLNDNKQSILHGVASVNDGHASLSTDRLPTGDYTLEMRPISDDGDYPKFAYPITVKDTTSSHVYIDSIGRCIVNGKPFMPLGWFVAGITRNWKNANDLNCSLDVMSKSPFNTIMPYNGLRLPDTKLNGMDAIREGLDACRGAGIMVIYSLKDLYPSNKQNTYLNCTNKDTAALLVNALKDHPAILAWYTSDEMPKNMLPEIMERRRMINRLDPDHPTWALFCSYADIPYFGGGYDVLGIDPYPLNSRQDSGILSVAQALDDTQKAALRTNGAMALWAVLQAFNAALYNSKATVSAEDFFKSTRCPTAQESLAMALLHAIHGAKGFIFYSDFDLRKSHEALRYDERWKALCQMGDALKSLEPFILSDRPHIPLHVETTQGRVDAAALQSPQGDVAMILVSPLRDGGTADISGEKLPSGMISKYGHTVEISPGKYRFHGAAAECDILMGKQDVK